MWTRSQRIPTIQEKSYRADFFFVYCSVQLSTQQQDLEPIFDSNLGAFGNVFDNPIHAGGKFRASRPHAAEVIVSRHQVDRLRWARRHRELQHAVNVDHKTCARRRNKKIELRTKKS